MHEQLVNAWIYLQYIYIRFYKMESDYNMKGSVSVQLKLIVTAGASLKKWRKLASKSKDRFHRLNELVTTQKDYFNDLNKIKDWIREPLLSNKIITQEQAKSMFPNIQGMIDFSSQIYKQLAIVLERWNRKDTLLGATMIKFSQFFIIYSDFFKNLLKTQQALKDILTKSQKARSIEKQLSTPNKIVTFEDLISKPFQRPLKYHLILRDYWSNIDASHPDYQYLRNAIDLYHKVNERNNEAMENREREQTLFGLNNKYGNIIESETKYYIGQYDAVCLQTPVIIYLISNLVLLVNKTRPDKEFMRISFDKYSHIETAGDSELFKNRLYFYGNKVCVHLTFIDKLRRDDFYHILRKQIIQININETTRENVINQRTSVRRSTLKRKFSFTNLEPQLLRPINVKIIGLESRELGINELRTYYAIEFYPTPASFNNNYTPHHLSLIDEETINKLQKLINHLYPDQLKCMPIFAAPRSIINELQYRKNQPKRLQIRTIFIQLFLNSLFRCTQIVKRIDYVMHVLHISDPIWNYLKIKEQQNCSCNVCMSRPEFKRCEDYYKEVLDRQFKKVKVQSNLRKTQYCEIRTITSHQQYSSIYPELLLKATSEERIAWCKSKLGKINHSLTNLKPQSKFTKTVSIKVTIRGFPNMKEHTISVYPHDRVKKIISLLGHKAQMNLEDYVLVAEINNKAFILEEDEPISNVFLPEEEAGLLDKISNFFSKKEEVVIHFTLEKYWVIFNPNDYTNMHDKSRRLKVNTEVQSIMGRLYSNEMRVGEEDLLQFYALFMCKKYYSEYRTFTVDKVAIKVRNRSQFYFPSRLHDESTINRLFQRIKKITNDASIQSDYDIGLKIISKASQRPGWSCIMFDCTMETGLNEPIRVRIGCDLRGVRVRESGKINMLLEFRLQDDTWAFHTIGSTMIITDNQKIFRFTSRQIWKICQQIEFYKLYIKNFGVN